MKFIYVLAQEIYSNYERNLIEIFMNAADYEHEHWHQQIKNGINDMITDLQMWEGYSEYEREYLECAIREAIKLMF